MDNPGRERPHISPTQLDLYLTCGEAYRRRYIERERSSPAPPMLRGTAVHKAAEINHRQKKETGRDLPLSDLVDAAATAFDEAFDREGVTLSVQEQIEGPARVLGKAKDSAVRLTGLYAREIAPKIEPDLVEERVEIQLPGGVDMVGILDITTTDRRIKDLKTSGREKSQSDVDHSIQLTWYSLSYLAKTGHEPAGVDLEVLIDKTVPEHQVLTATRTRRDYETLIAKVNVMLAGVDAGVFLPAPPGHWRCSPRWCSFFRTCPYVNAERKAAAAA